MRSAILLNCIVLAHAKELAANRNVGIQDSMDDTVDKLIDSTSDKLLDRALKVLHNSDLDDTTLAKPSGSAIPGSRLAMREMKAPDFVGKAPKQPSLANLPRLPSFSPDSDAARALGGVLLAPVLAGLVAFAPITDAQAARSGGRVGGSSGFSRGRSAPRAVAPQAAPRTNVYVAPSPTKGFGMGGGMGY
jgi:hypothetical protein